MSLVLRSTLQFEQQAQRLPLDSDTLLEFAGLLNFDTDGESQDGDLCPETPSNLPHMPPADFNATESPQKPNVLDSISQLMEDLVASRDGALLTLNVPAKILDYLETTSRSWAIISSANHDESLVDSEVSALRTILKCIELQAQLKGTHRREKIREQPDPRYAELIFIHVGSWGAVRKLGWMSERTNSDAYVRFYTFGSHPSVEPFHWGVKEIYPCGASHSHQYLKVVFMKG